ncbi:MAG: hypothetical protein JW849_08820 [Phycisphaerae bacterium]|nr:hypothetical protein [Phycisphaerae bacterium]
MSKKARKIHVETPSSEEPIKMPHEPKTRKGLQRAAKALLGVTFPEKAICPHHNAPLDYLEASFLRQKDLLVWANRGGGKTMLAAVATLLDALYRAPVKIRVLGGSFDQSDRLAEYIREFVQRRPELVEGRMYRDRITVVGGSEIRMLAQSQRAVRGQHVQKIRCDEVDLFDDDVWQAVQFATRSKGKTRGSIEVLSTLHRQGGLMHQLVQNARGIGREGDSGPGPADPQPGDTPFGYHLVNWCLWEVIERCGPERNCKDCLLAEDCQGVAKQAEGFFRIDDAITIKARSSRAAWESEMLCRGPRRQWLVFEEFDPAVHVRKVEYCADWPLYRAMDFGYASPLVCLWVQVTPAGAVHVIDEYLRTRLPLAKHAATILARDLGRVEMTYVDPAGRQKESTSGAACTELLSAAGIPCVSRPSSIVDGLELIRAALAPATGGPRLYVHPRCEKLIEAFASYHYPPPSSPEPDKPVKDGPDHAVDALRYFFVNRLRPAGETQRGRY